MDRVGGSSRVREELVAALAEGRGVTAKIRWVSRNDDEGRGRWIHCTPLLGTSGNVGVWMVVLVDDEQSHVARRFRKAPPVAHVIGQSKAESNRDNGRITERSGATGENLTLSSNSVKTPTINGTPLGSRDSTRPSTAKAAKSLSPSSQVSFNVEE